MLRFALLTTLLVVATKFNAAPHKTDADPEGTVVPELAHIVPEQVAVRQNE